MIANPLFARKDDIDYYLVAEVITSCKTSFASCEYHIIRFTRDRHAFTWGYPLIQPGGMYVIDRQNEAYKGISVHHSRFSAVEAYLECALALGALGRKAEMDQMLEALGEADLKLFPFRLTPRC